MAQRARIGASSFCVDAELAVHLGEKLGAIPLIRVLLARAEGVDKFARDIFRDAENVVTLIFSFERGTPDGVNGLALVVDYVVVLKQVFAGIVVLRFDGFLRVFYAPRDELGFYGYAFGHTQAVHQRFHALAAENAHQVVFKRKKKARRARVALAAGAPT